MEFEIVERGLRRFFRCRRWCRCLRRFWRIEVEIHFQVALNRIADGFIHRFIVGLPLLPELFTPGFHAFSKIFAPFFHAFADIFHTRLKVLGKCLSARFAFFFGKGSGFYERLNFSDLCAEFCGFSRTYFYNLSDGLKQPCFGVDPVDLHTYFIRVGRSSPCASRATHAQS